MEWFWLAEAPNYPGVYATGSKVGPATADAYAARRFASKEECQWWCRDNPHPFFAPVEHGFTQRNAP